MSRTQTSRRAFTSVVDGHVLPKVIQVGPNVYGAAFHLMKLLPAQFILTSAIETGELTEGTTVVETTSGTFGLGLAMVCRLKGIPWSSWGPGDRAAAAPSAEGARCPGEHRLGSRAAHPRGAAGPSGPGGPHPVPAQLLLHPRPVRQSAEPGVVRCGRRTPAGEHGHVRRAGLPGRLGRIVVRDRLVPAGAEPAAEADRRGHARQRALRRPGRAPAAARSRQRADTAGPGAHAVRRGPLAGRGDSGSPRRGGCTPSTPCTWGRPAAPRTTWPGGTPNGIRSCG